MLRFKLNHVSKRVPDLNKARAQLWYVLFNKSHVVPMYRFGDTVISLVLQPDFFLCYSV